MGRILPSSTLRKIITSGIVYGKTFINKDIFTLKGEGKNVYDNEGDWIARILQTLEGFEDLFLESGINHVHFDVNISGTFSGVIE